MPKIGTDNGPQFISHEFGNTCDSLGVEHERIPVKSPNMNAHIESFHSILEAECYSRYEFASFMNVYENVTNYMKYYTERRRHGSLKNTSPKGFFEAFMNKTVEMKSFVA